MMTRNETRRIKQDLKMVGSWAAAFRLHWHRFLPASTISPTFGTLPDDPKKRRSCVNGQAATNGQAEFFPGGHRLSL